MSQFVIKKIYNKILNKLRTEMRLAHPNLENVNMGYHNNLWLSVAELSNLSCLKGLIATVHHSEGSHDKIHPSTCPHFAL